MRGASRCSLCGRPLRGGEEVEHFCSAHADVVRRLNSARRRPLKPEALLRVLRRAGLVERAGRGAPAVLCELCGWAYTARPGEGLAALSRAAVEHFRSSHPWLAPPPSAAAAAEMDALGLVTVKPRAWLRRELLSLLEGAALEALRAELVAQRGTAARIPLRRITARLRAAGAVGEPRAARAWLRPLLARWVGRELEDGVGRLWRVAGLDGGLLLERAGSEAGGRGPGGLPEDSQPALAELDGGV